VPAGAAVVRVDSPGPTAEQTLDLSAGSTYTVVVRDLSGGLGVVSILDFAAAQQVPAGGVDAGLGGALGMPSNTWWRPIGLVMLAAGLFGLVTTRLPRRSAER
jgi:hypothetical protein